MLTISVAVREGIAGDTDCVAVLPSRLVSVALADVLHQQGHLIVPMRA